MVAVPSPLSVKLTPDGNVPLRLIEVTVGVPDVVTVNVPAVPTVNVVDAALVKDGGVPTLSRADALVALPTLLVNTAR